MKVIESFQQTFINDVASQSSTFNFTRVYKKDPNHRIQISVASISYESTGGGTTYTPHLFFCNHPDFNGNSTVQLLNGETRSGWFLGAMGNNNTENQKSASSVFQESTQLVNDISVNPFTISIRTFSGNAEASKFAISFNINVVEM